MTLQVKDTSGKLALSYDMSILNGYVEKNKFKMGSWEEIFNYSIDVNFAIKFDLKKFHHEIDINEGDKEIFWIHVQNGR